MTPRAGGEADKFGNRYEGAWTVRQLLEIIAGRAGSIQIEPFGELGAGVEFTLKVGDRTTVHQVKRQAGELANWTLKRLEREGVLETAAKHADAGRDFYFISSVPARELDELSDRARRSKDVKEFIEGQLTGQRLQSLFTQLTGVWGGPQLAWHRLRSTYVTSADERELRAANEALAGALLTGATPAAAVAALADLAAQNIGQTLAVRDIFGAASEYGLTKVRELGTSGADEAVGRGMGRWLAAVEAELLDPHIARPESRAIVDAVEARARVVLAVGAAGAGKTGVLHEVATALPSKHWALFALRLDHSRPVRSASDLGQVLGLDDSPVSALASVAGERNCLLIIDQLDAVSLASGRPATASFDAVAELLRQADAFPSMRVLLAVRRFDLDNDHRLRGLIADPPEHVLLEVEPLDDEQVNAAVQAMGVDPLLLASTQRDLLRVPLNLSLLHAIAGERQALTFQTTRDLMGAFWNRKRWEARESAGREVRFEAVVARLVEEMSARQRLAVPVAVLDAEGLQSDADVLRSAHVLVGDGGLVAFFHEAFFDYAFARGWSARGDSLLAFLLKSAQELFRRAQVRQVLLHLRDEDPARFRREAEDVLSDDRVRFHLKDVVIAILRSLPDPSIEDWEVIERLLQLGLPFDDRLWQAVRTREWFVGLDDADLIERWLASERPELQARALETMAAAADTDSDRIARLLESQIDHADFSAWFRWLGTWLPFDQSRPLFDLLLQSVGRGEWTEALDHLGLVTHNLGEAKPGWACELLVAWLVDRPGSLAVDSGRVPGLESTDYTVLELARHGSREPRPFVDGLLGYMLEVMQLTEYDSARRPVADPHFGHRVWHGDRYRLDEALLFGMSEALTRLVCSDPEAALKHLEQLAADPHDGAQWLLYEALRAGAPRFADWSAEILQQGEHRLYSGYTCDSFWTTRQLLEAYGAHFRESDFRAVESIILQFSPEWESPPGGYAQFTLLSALPEERMSRDARRRLGELQRRFNSASPDEPRGIVSGWVGSPIPQTAVPRMSDDDWLRAAAKHSAEREDFTSFTGGARELANVLAQETEKDPERFARLGRRFGAGENPVYLAAVLRGLGQTGQAFDPSVVFALVLHASQLGQPELDRWLGWSLRKGLGADLPDDVLGLVLDRALHAADPETDQWLEQAESGQSYYGGDPFHAGMNSARGESALVLGDILVPDVDGARTRLVAPHLAELAADPTMAVRACVAQTINASLRHAPDEAVAAFKALVETDDRVLASDPVERLIAAVGFKSLPPALAVVRRMISSEWPNVRQAGGRLAAFFGLELEATELFEAAVASRDPHVRTGVALVCAERLPYARASERAAQALVQLFDDESAEVREAAARVAAALRDRGLEPYRHLLLSLIDSRSFSKASNQLLWTLERTPSRVGDIALRFAERFVAQQGGDVGNIATRAAGHAKDVAALLLRAYAQSPTQRSAALDLIDQLLLAGGWGVADVVGDAER
jgi:hypothetical protein